MTRNGAKRGISFLRYSRTLRRIVICPCEASIGGDREAYGGGRNFYGPQ